jgi:AcrR family transcriptional regulator
MDGMTTAGVTVPEGNAGAGQGRKTPGRPRNARADDAILDALTDMLVEGQGVDAISIEAVAARAGVGKATIYRRWANKEELLIDAVRRMKGPPPEPAGDNVRDDLIMLVTVGKSKRYEEYSRAAACLIPELVRSPRMHEVYVKISEPRREAMRTVLRRGIETGELRADLNVEMTVLILSAPNVVRNTMGLVPAVNTDDYPEQLVDAVLRGAAA